MKKLLSLIMALAVCAGGGILTGCKPKDDNSGIVGIESAKYDASKEQLVVATNAQFAPFEYKLGNKFAGIDMEVAKGFADYLGQELVIMDMDFDSVVTSVGKNGVDIGMAGLTVNETRKQSVDFTDSYYEASQMVIVKKDDTTFDACTTAEQVEALLNVAGKKIGVQSGTTGQYLVEGDEDWDFPGYKNAQCVKHTNAGLAVKDMLNGNIDYVVVDAAPAKAIVASMSGVKVINIELTEEEYAFGVDKAQPELLAKANEYLAKIKGDGTYEAIAQKYFTQYEEVAA